MDKKKKKKKGFDVFIVGRLGSFYIIALLELVLKHVCVQQRELRGTKNEAMGY